MHLCTFTPDLSPKWPRTYAPSASSVLPGARPLQSDGDHQLLEGEPLRVCITVRSSAPQALQVMLFQQVGSCDRLVGWRTGWRPSLSRLEAIALRSQAIAGTSW